jgi:hypothetical protein
LGDQVPSDFGIPIQMQPQRLPGQQSLVDHVAQEPLFPIDAGEPPFHGVREILVTQLQILLRDFEISNLADDRTVDPVSIAENCGRLRRGVATGLLLTGRQGQKANEHADKAAYCITS